VHDFAVHGESFNLSMRKMQNCSTRRLVNTAAFHPNKTVLDDVHPANPMFATDFVQRL
jgi:hypothetical protein